MKQYESFYTLLEAAVADHLGVKPAVARTGDLLEEDAVELIGLPVSVFILNMLPYIFTIVVLILVLDYVLIQK